MKWIKRTHYEIHSEFLSLSGAILVLIKGHYLRTRKNQNNPVRFQADRSI